MYIYPTINNRNIIYNKYHENKVSEHTITAENANYINGLKKYLRPKTGKGLLNTILQKVPLPEMHLYLPNSIQSEDIQNGSYNNTGKYSYCGPGTKVQQRLKEGYQGVNTLDKVCKQHDIFYSKNKKTKERNIGDDILANQASHIALDHNEPEYVRNDTKLVTTIMAAKSKFGMGSKNLTSSLRK